MDASSSIHVLLSGVTKNFESRLGRIEALGPVDVELRKGEFFAVVGPSGCGKSTLLDIIAALAKMAKIDVKKPSAAAIAIETQTELMGTRVAARTIENHLNRIPEALERREGK